MKGIKIIMIIGMALTAWCQTAAQVDPTRAAAIDFESKRARKVINAQMKAQAAMAASHTINKTVVDANMYLVKEFNDYLTDFRDYLTTAAEMFGLYIEIKKLANTVGDLQAAIQNEPDNMLAAGLTSSGSRMYVEIVTLTTDLVKDIKNTCLTNKKMTQKEFNTVLSGIRPKFYKLNSELRRITNMIRYTSFVDIYRSLVTRSHRVNRANKLEIIRQRKEIWFDKAYSIR